MKLIYALLLCPLFVACGVENASSELKAPPSQVYRFNADGSGGAIKAWNIGGSLSCVPSWMPELPPMCNAPVVNGNVVFWGSFPSNVYAPPIIHGPYLNFEPGPSKIGHLSAEVDLEALGSAIPGVVNLPVVGDLTLVVDISSASGTVIHAAKTVTLRADEGRKTIAVNMDPFRESIKDVEVRVRDISVLPNDIMSFTARPNLRIYETRIIYN